MAQAWTFPVHQYQASLSSGFRTIAAKRARFVQFANALECCTAGNWQLCYLQTLQELSEVRESDQITRRTACSNFVYCALTPQASHIHLPTLLLSAARCGLELRDGDNQCRPAGWDACETYEGIFGFSANYVSYFLGEVETKIFPKKIETSQKGGQGVLKPFFLPRPISPRSLFPS